MKGTAEGSLLQLDRQFCFALYSASLALGKVYRQLLKKLKLTYPQYLVMLVLWEKDELRVSDIGERLYLNSATLTPLLKRLEGLKLLTRERSGTDERQVIVKLTRAGRDLRAKAEAIPLAVAGALDCAPEAIKARRDELVNIRTKLMASPAYTDRE